MSLCVCLCVTNSRDTGYVTLLKYLSTDILLFVLIQSWWQKTQQIDFIPNVCVGEKHVEASVHHPSDCTITYCRVRRASHEKSVKGLMPLTDDVVSEWNKGLRSVLHLHTQRWGEKPDMTERD